MKNLLTVEAVIEVGTGLMLVALPSLLTTLLLGLMFRHTDREFGLSDVLGNVFHDFGA